MPADTQYAYAVSRIRAIESGLLNKLELDRMVDARNPDDALKMILDRGYGYSSDSICSVYEFEKLLREEIDKVYKLLKEISPEPEIFNLFLRRIDYHNVKVLLKQEFSGAGGDKAILDAGLISAANLRRLIEERKLQELPPIMGEAVEEAIDTYNRTGDPQNIDLIIDRADFAQMKADADSSGYPFLINLVAAMIDLANIKTCLRIKNMNKYRDTFEKAFIPGGSIHKDEFIKCLHDSVEAFVHSMKYTPYGALCEEGAAGFQRTRSFMLLEKLSDNYINSYIKKAHFVLMGPEPLIGYYMAKQNETRNVRIIMVGKINGIPREVIRERLRDTYV